MTIQETTIGGETVGEEIIKMEPFGHSGMVITTTTGPTISVMVMHRDTQDIKTTVQQTVGRMKFSFAKWNVEESERNSPPQPSNPLVVLEPHESQDFQIDVHLQPHATPT